MKKLIISALVILACGFAFKSGSQGQSNERILKVAIYVNGNEDELFNNLLESQIKQHLNRDKDIKIVDMSKEWHVIIAVSTLTVELEEISHHEDHIVIDTGFLLNVTQNCKDWNEHQLIKAVMFPNPGYLMLYEKSKIVEIKDIIMNQFDTDILSKFRN